MRLAVNAVTRYASLKLNDQNMEDDVTIAHPENKNFTRKIPKLCTRKPLEKESSLLWPSACYAYPDILRQKALQVPSKTGE
jgi:hypothetical protein